MKYFSSMIFAIFNLKIRIKHLQDLIIFRVPNRSTVPAENFALVNKRWNMLLFKACPQWRAERFLDRGGGGENIKYKFYFAKKWSILFIN